MDGGTREIGCMDATYRPVTGTAVEQGAFLETLNAVAPLQVACPCLQRVGMTSLFPHQLYVFAGADGVEAVGEIQHFAGGKCKESAEDIDMDAGNVLRIAADIFHALKGQAFLQIGVECQKSTAVYPDAVSNICDTGFEGIIQLSRDEILGRS